MASSAIRELRACTSLMRQCCSNWSGFPQSNVTNCVAVVSGINKCVLVALMYKFIEVNLPNLSSDFFSSLHNTTHVLVQHVDNSRVFQGKNHVILQNQIISL